MILTDRSKQNIKNIKKIKYLFNNKDVKLDKKTKIYIYDIYKHLIESNNKLKAIDYDKIREIRKINSDLLHGNNKYISEEIKSYINKKALYEIKYIYKINERTISLSFIVFSENEIKKLENLHKYDHYAYRVFLVLDVLFSYANKECSRHQEIKIYMTPFERKMPKKNSGKILGPEHLNGGVSYVCPKNGEVTIYIKQEWFKVFIHESFHNLGFDFANMDLSNFNKKIYTIFPIKSEFNIFEAYCEFWALTLNVIIVSFLELNSRLNITLEKLMVRFKEYMFIEQTFTYIQVNKILDYMGLKYTDLFDTEKGYEKEENSTIVREKFNETTNVFAYYICKMIFLSDYNKFIAWCIANNNNYFDFNKTILGLDSLFEYILNNYKSHSLINNINNINIYLPFNGSKTKNYTKKYKTKNKRGIISNRNSSYKYKTQDKAKTWMGDSLCLTSIEIK